MVYQTLMGSTFRTFPAVHAQIAKENTPKAPAPIDIPLDRALVWLDDITHA